MKNVEIVSILYFRYNPTSALVTNLKYDQDSNNKTAAQLKNVSDVIESCFCKSVYLHVNSPQITKVNYT